MFKLESEMKEPVQRWLQDQGLQTKTEYHNPWGICDLVGCAFDRNKIHQRLSLRQRRPVGPPFRIHLLLQIPDQETGKSISASKIYENYSGLFDFSEVSNEIDELVARRFVVRTKRGNLQKINGWMPLQTKVVAVELKLSRISEAISQARNNRQLTPDSYVALPAEKASSIAEVRPEALTNQGIGLLAVSDFSCEVLIAPARSRNQVDRTAEFHCAERFWQTYLKAT